MSAPPQRSLVREGRGAVRAPVATVVGPGDFGRPAAAAAAAAVAVLSVVELHGQALHLLLLLPIQRYAHIM